MRSQGQRICGRPRGTIAQSACTRPRSTTGCAIGPYCGDQAPMDQDALEASQHAGIRRWVEERLGGEVREIERLARWRPCWKITYATGAVPSAIFVRGHRP